MSIISPTRYSVTALVATGVPSLPHGAVFSGMPSVSCWAQFCGCMSTKCADAGVAATAEPSRIETVVVRMGLFRSSERILVTGPRGALPERKAKRTACDRPVRNRANRPRRPRARGHV